MAYFRRKQAEWNAKHGYGTEMSGSTVNNSILPTHNASTITPVNNYDQSTGTGVAGHHHHHNATTGAGLVGSHNTTTTGNGLTGNHHHHHNTSAGGTGLLGTHDRTTVDPVSGATTAGTGLTGRHHDRHHRDRHDEKTVANTSINGYDDNNTRRSGGGLGGLFGRKRNKSTHSRTTRGTGFDVMSSDFNRRPSFGQWLKFIWLDILVMAAMGAVGLGVYNADPAPSRSFPINFVDGSVVYPQFAYPIRTEIVPIWEAALLASLVPIAVILLMQIRIRSFWDVNNAILGLLYSLITAAVFQVFIKWLIGGLRPHFLYVCAPDLTKVGAGGQGFANLMFQRDVCTGDRKAINDSLESMPSGHSTAAFAGFVFLYLYLNAKLKVFSNYHPAFWKMIVLYAPLLGACLIAGSLTIDEYHNWYDCLAGAVIGTIMAFSAYRMVYASVWDFRFNHIPLTRHTPFSFGAGQAGAGGFESAIATRKAGWGYDEAYGGAPFDAAYHLRGTMAGFNNAVNYENHPSQHKSGGLLGGMMHKNNDHHNGRHHDSTASTVNQPGSVYDTTGRRSLGQRDGVYDDVTTRGRSHSNRDGAYDTSTTSQANDPRSTNYGPHKSNMLNKLDPRVDSNLDGSRTVGNRDSTNNTTNYTTTTSPLTSNPNTHRDHNPLHHNTNANYTTSTNPITGNTTTHRDHNPLHHSNSVHRTGDIYAPTSTSTTGNALNTGNVGTGVGTGLTGHHHHHNSLGRSDIANDGYAPTSTTINNTTPFTSTVTTGTGLTGSRHHHHHNSLGGRNDGYASDHYTRDLERDGALTGTEDNRYRVNSRSLERKALRGNSGGI